MPQPAPDELAASSHFSHDTSPPDIGMDQRFITMLHRSMPTGLIIHSLFLALFIYLSIKPLIYFNIASVLIYGLCIYLLRRDQYNLAITLCWLEVIGHATVASIVLGIEGGFQYYIIVLVPLIFVNAARSHLNKIVFAGLLCLLYLALDSFMRQSQPIDATAEKVIVILRGFNIINSFILLGYLSFVYRKVVVEVEARLTKTNANLQRALSEVRTLRGIVPICSFCKKIRDDRGYWEQVDVYINQHSEADVSHSVCPDCLAQHYPDYTSRNP